MTEEGSRLVAAVMIGIDPHKGSHTAVAIDAAEGQLGTLQVRASASQASRLVEWAAAWPDRTWAVEGAGGLGHLLAQQLVAAGEQVLDVQPKLGSRVRLLSSGKSAKNDPNDARSVAIAALRSPARTPVAADDHAAVLKVWAKRHRDLSRLRCQAACRLHAALCQLIPGGVPKAITAAAAAALLEANPPSGPVQAARHQFAAELTADLRQLDGKRHQARRQLTAAVRASGTTLTGIFGVGPVIAATILGDAGDIGRFPDRDHFAAYNGTAPVEASSGKRKVFRLSRRGNRRMNHAVHMAAVTQIRNRHSDGRAYYDKKIAEGKTGKEALRALKRRVSDVIYRQLQADARTAAARSGAAGPGGQPGNGSVSSAAGSHPARRLFGPATPEPAPSVRPRRQRPVPAPPAARAHASDRT
jgi:transposase